MLHGSVCTYDGSSVPHFLIVSGWGVDLPICGPSSDPLLYRPLPREYTTVVFRISGGADGDSLCKGGSCNSCKSALIKIMVVVVVVAVVVVGMSCESCES